MVFEGTAAAQWLVETLNGSPDLLSIVSGIFHDRAAQGAVLPYVIWWQHGDGDDENSAGDRAFSNVLRGVKVVSKEGDQDDVSSAALDLIDGLLANVSTDISSGNIRLNVKSAGEIDNLELAAGVRGYRHRGRLWRMTTSA